jgi:hypothetical protein
LNAYITPIAAGPLHVNKFRRTLLLLGLQAQCRADQDKDWRSLHKRDREWYLAQAPQGRWQLALHWVQQFAAPLPWVLAISPLLLTMVGIFLGAGLMSGLLQFQPQQRINLWWWLLLGVWLPAIWWLFGLWLSRSAGNGVWAHALLRRLPPVWRTHDVSLLGLTARTLSQRLSLGFALGLVGAFFAYLLISDLAFGWSSTLDVSAERVHRLTQILSLPWRKIWPEAAPSLQLIEQTRFFRVEQIALVEGERFGEWWRFLLMNLLTYVLAPRILSLAWAEWRLGRAQQRLFTQDACIDGWWQRLHFEQIRQHAEPAPRNRRPSPARVGATPVPDGSGDRITDHWPMLHGVVAVGQWPDEQLGPLITGWPEPARSLPLLTEDQAFANAPPGRAYLLLCKGWEPPTGALADLCQTMHEHRHQAYLWPVPLAGMKPERAHQLRASWQMFISRLPPSCHLLEPEPDA